MGGCQVGAALPCRHENSADIAILVGGAFGVVGTSLSSPEFAGLQALQESRLGSRAGNANFLIGNGTVRGAQYALDPFGPFAGDPQTPSNP